MSESRDTQAVGSDPSCKWYVSMLSCASRRSCPSSRNLRIESAHGRPARLSGERFQVDIGHDGVLKLVLLSKYVQSLVSLGWSYHIYNIYISLYILTWQDVVKREPRWRSDSDPYCSHIDNCHDCSCCTISGLMRSGAQIHCSQELVHVPWTSHPSTGKLSTSKQGRSAPKLTPMALWCPMCQDDVDLTTINHHLWGQQLF